MGHVQDAAAGAAAGDASQRNDIVLRPPTAADGAAVWDLVAACRPLDQNSLYMNLIQCSHFADTCVVAERDGAIVGWVSGHVPPNQPDAYFLWQVAVGENGRGRGLATRMIDDLFARDALKHARTLITTITPGNAASWALFRGFAKSRGAALRDQPWFDKDEHFAGRHDTEHLVTIGPLPAASASPDMSTTRKESLT